MAYYTDRGTAIRLIEFRENGMGLYQEVLSGAMILCNPETIVVRT